MSRQLELFSRAAECERRREMASDRKTKVIFTRLRDAWIVLANQSSGLARSAIAKDIAALEEIQSIFEENTGLSQ